MPRVIRPLRLPLTLLGAIAAAVALTGCVGISSTSSNQARSMGAITLTINGCASGSPSCSAPANSGRDVFGLMGSQSAGAQLLLAIRLPDGAAPPDGLQAALGGGTLALTRSASYEGELQTLEPAPAGERWWGWISNVFTYSRASPQSFGVSLTISLPRPADGGPLESPLRWRPVVGVRDSQTDGLLASRPVDCGHDNDDLYDGFHEFNQAGGTITCIDSPSREGTRGFLNASFIDFGILGSSITAAPGTAVTAAFIARRTGGVDTGTTFSLSATTAIPGGSVKIDRNTVQLSGDATQPVLATIDVPAGTKSGSYPVTLTATAPDKPTRTGTVTVTLPTRPRITDAAVKPRRFRAKRGSRAGPVGAKLSFRLSEGGTVAIDLKRLRARGRAKRALARAFTAGRHTLTLRKRLGKVKLRPGSYLATLTARGSTGQVSDTATVRFTVAPS